MTFTMRFSVNEIVVEHEKLLVIYVATMRVLDDVQCLRICFPVAAPREMNIVILRVVYLTLVKILLLAVYTCHTVENK